MRRILGVLAVAAAAAWAQSTDASLSGTALDPTGAGVPGVAITITNTRTGVASNTSSNDVGA